MHQCKATFSDPHMRLHDGARPELYGGVGEFQILGVWSFQR
jgi:hypothetical protein